MVHTGAEPRWMEKEEGKEHITGLIKASGSPRLLTMLERLAGSLFGIGALKVRNGRGRY